MAGLRIFGACLILLALAGFGYQIFLFLQTGSWYSFSVIDLLAMNGPPERIGDNIDAIRLWAVAPTSWFGLHQVLSYINVPFVLLIWGFFSLIAE